MLHRQSWELNVRRQRLGKAKDCSFIHHSFYSFKLSKVICLQIWKLLCLPKNINLEKAGHAMLPKDCDSSRTLCDLKVVRKSNHTKSSKYYQKRSINWLSSRIVHQQFAGYNFIRIIHSMKNVLPRTIVVT
jgi:hypothetical protein